MRRNLTILLISSLRESNPTKSSIPVDLTKERGEGGRGREERGGSSGGRRAERGGGGGGEKG